MTNKILFSKTDFNRVNKFLITTLITKNNDQLFVVKKPNTVEAVHHLKQIHNNHQIWNKYFINNFQSIISKLLSNNLLILPFIKKPTLEKEILDLLILGKYKSADKKILHITKTIQNLSVQVLNEKKQYKSKFFGNYVINKGVKIFPITNLDLSCGNILRIGSKYEVFDLEWVEDIPIETNFLLFNLFYLLSIRLTPIFLKLSVNYELVDIGNNRLIPKKWINTSLVLTTKLHKKYLSRLNRFQKTVTFKTFSNFNKQKYYVSNKETSDLNQQKNKTNQANNTNESSDYKQTIAKLNQILLEKQQETDLYLITLNKIYHSKTWKIMGYLKSIGSIIQKVLNYKSIL